MKHLAPLARIAVAVSLMFPSATFAQEQPLVLPDRSEVEAGEAYVSDIFRDWQVRCIRSEADEIPDRCEMFQLLEEENGNPIAEFRIAVAIRPDEDTVATATLLTPLDTLLSQGLILAVDDNEPARVPYAFCREIGCFVQLALGPEDVQVFQDGADITIELFALIRDPQTGQMGGAPVPTSASLRGFTAAYEALEAHVETIREYIAAQEAAQEEGATE